MKEVEAKELLHRLVDHIGAGKSAEEQKEVLKKLGFPSSMLSALLEPAIEDTPQQTFIAYGVRNVPIQATITAKDMEEAYTKLKQIRSSDIVVSGVPGELEWKLVLPFGSVIKEQPGSKNHIED